ncbi:MAG: transaldolase [Elusimicrobia bacterium]|nr:transaldolase [Elusimicrobiota bacterium]
MNPLLQLKKAGQSVWLDSISRSLNRSGTLDRLIAEDGISGLTSNPTIFEGAISKGTDYDDFLRSRRQGSPEEVFEDLAVADIREAAERLLPVYDDTQGADGFVSIEVSPRLAYDAGKTVEEAKRLFQKVGKPNTMIKVPATKEGLPAISRLLADGVSVNATLLFSVSRYEAVLDTFLTALEDRVRRGAGLSHVASVASFFVSRVDTSVDKLLEEKAARTDSRKAKESLRSLMGKAAVANAVLAYRRFREVAGSKRFKALARKGAKVQRLLFASTGTKNPAYSDILYMTELVGPDTVNTAPMETLDAFRGHGKVRPSLAELSAKAKPTLDDIAAHGVDLDAVMRRLEDEGVKKFIESYEKLLKVIEGKRTVLA